MYLESSLRENNDFYVRFGFEVKALIELKRGPNTPVTLYCMVREPRPAVVIESSNEAVKA